MTRRRRPSSMATGDGHGHDGDDDDHGYDKPDPDRRRRGQPADQARHLHQQGERHPRSDAGRHHGDPQGDQPVDGDPAFSLGPAASPNHHELALRFTVRRQLLPRAGGLVGRPPLADQHVHDRVRGDALAGVVRRQAQRLRATTPRSSRTGRAASGSPTRTPRPSRNDYNQHGGIYAHLVRNGVDFVNFGNGFEFAMRRRGRRDRADRHPRARQRADGKGRARPHRPPVPRVQHAHPRRAAAREPRSLQPLRALQAGVRRRTTSTARAASASCRATSTSTTRTITAAAPTTSTRAEPAWDFTRFVQDNDAALGLTVELISKSPCWKDTVIFVVEDDTQNGLDHVDGYRSIFLAISPWVKRENVTKTHLSLASHLQDGRSDPGDAAAQPVRRGGDRPARPLHRRNPTSRPTTSCSRLTSPRRRRAGRS